jgi:hypothetical protein
MRAISHLGQILGFSDFDGRIMPSRRRRINRCVGTGMTHYSPCSGRRNRRDHRPHKRAEWWDKREGKRANIDVDYPIFPMGPAAFACTSTFCSCPVTEPARLQRSSII